MHGSENQHRDAALQALYAQDQFVLKRRHLAFDIRYELVDDAGKPLLFIVRPRRLLRTFVTAGLVLFTILATVAGFVVGLALAERLAPSDSAALIMCASLAVLGLIAGGLLVAVTAANHDVHFYCDAAGQHLFLQVLEHKVPLLLRADYAVVGPLGKEQLGTVRWRLWTGWKCASPEGQVLCWLSGNRGDYRLIGDGDDDDDDDASQEDLDTGDTEVSPEDSESIDYERRWDPLQGSITRRFGPLDRYQIVFELERLRPAGSPPRDCHCRAAGCDGEVRLHASGVCGQPHPGRRVSQATFLLPRPLTLPFAERADASMI